MIIDPTGRLVQQLVAKCDPEDRRRLLHVLQVLNDANGILALRVGSFKLEHQGNDMYSISIGRRKRLYFTWDSRNGNAFDCHLI
jgi:plasmid maintenance system killer protein